MVIRTHSELQRMLEHERSRLKVQLGRNERWTEQQVGCGNHMAEDATVAFEQAKDLAVRACLADMLDDVEHALLKFSLGLYGACERCERQIDWARLEAKPEARLCIKCQQKSEWRR